MLNILPIIVILLFLILVVDAPLLVLPGKQFYQHFLDTSSPLFKVCPLCCEELDISDRSFYPCKCGYQICMWCWHKIKETENGKCPACRTDYGDDPHAFSEIDLGDVVKAQKEKKAQVRTLRQGHLPQSGWSEATAYPSEWFCLSETFLSETFSSSPYRHYYN